MDQKIIKNIFKKYNLGAVKSVKKIDMEVYFYNFLKNKIFVPEIKIFDKSKDIYEKYFMIYLKIEGDNLYSIWHLLNNDERRNIIKQLCSILKIINKSNSKFFERY